jgi:hypothetical protein
MNLNSFLTNSISEKREKDIVKRHYEVAEEIDWATWNALPQTIKFFSILKENRNKLLDELSASAYEGNVVSDYFNAKLAEAGTLDKIIKAAKGNKPYAT